MKTNLDCSCTTRKDISLVKGYKLCDRRKNKNIKFPPIILCDLGLLGDLQTMKHVASTSVVIDVCRYKLITLV